MIVDAPTLHASCVAAEGRGLLIVGRPGAGKSALALDLVALGAELVADDVVGLRRAAGGVEAFAPAARGLVEARGIGLLRLPARASAPVVLVLDLDRAEAERLPPRRRARLRGAEVPLLLAPQPLRPASVLACVLHGPPLDPDASPEG